MVKRVMSLFRNEVMEHRRDRLHGSVHMALPISWQFIGGLLFFIVVAGGIFLATASYSRIETVSGILTPQNGVGRIVASRSGIISEILVRDGGKVSQRQPLVRIRGEEILASGTASQSEILDSLGQQETSLASQQRQVAIGAAASRAQLDARISGLKADVAGLHDQIAVQQGLVATAKNELEQARKIADRGFISRRDILLREETYLTRQQQLSQLRQNLARQQALIDETRRIADQSRATESAQVAALASQKSEIGQRRTTAQASESLQLNAPIAGKVTALTARIGQAVAPQQPLMLIVPENSSLRAELYVPSAAIGFLDIGQEVQLALDAFPYQRFGTVPGRVSNIASAPVLQPQDQAEAVPVYLVTVALDRQAVSAFGEQRAMLAGMTLTARITTEDQSLLEWLFEPLFALGKR